MNRRGDVRSGRRGLMSPHTALAALLLAAFGHYAWNAWSVAPLTGYDAPMHAGYVFTIVHEGRLPHPLEGWNTFHPPFYYALASGVWRALDGLGPEPLIAGLRAVGALPWLLAGLVSAQLVVRLGGSQAAAWVAAALFWFVPSNQLAAVMIGNEALAAALACFALWFVTTLQSDPRDRRAALAAGLFAGLALATKNSGLWVAAACGVPFLRRDLDRRALGAFAACVLAGAAVSAPVYVRNAVLTGSPLPMTRSQEPIRRAEAILTPRARRIGDHLRVDPRVVMRPSIYHLPGRPGDYASRNPAMSSVWSLTYAGFWYDPFGHRTPLRAHRDGVWWGTLLLLLGGVPTALVVAGLLLASAEALRRRGRSPDAPLAVMAWLAIASFVAFTWWAPTWGAVKGSYLLPVAAPAAVFFARAVDRLRPGARRAGLALSAVAALAAACVFSQGLVFRFDPRPALLPGWRYYDAQLPDAHIDDALRPFYGDG